MMERNSDDHESGKAGAAKPMRMSSVAKPEGFNISESDLGFLHRLGCSLRNKNSGKYEDAWTDDGKRLLSFVAAIRKGE